jgi:hypothetical protein
LGVCAHPKHCHSWLYAVSLGKLLLTVISRQIL